MQRDHQFHATYVTNHLNWEIVPHLIVRALKIKCHLSEKRDCVSAVLGLIMCQRVAVKEINVISVKPERDGQVK